MNDDLNHTIEYFAPTHHEILRFLITKGRLEMLLKDMKRYPCLDESRNEYRGIPFEVVEFEHQEGVEVTMGHTL